jgi:hypothetical protein
MISKDFQGLITVGHERINRNHFKEKDYVYESKLENIENSVYDFFFIKV